MKKQKGSTKILSAAPLNPTFKRYINRGQPVGLSSLDRHAKGYFPPPVKLPPFKGKVVRKTKGVLPAVYDLRVQGRMTPVRDQNGTSTCWAFGTYASMESCLLPEEVWNFSEQNMKNRLGQNCPTGFDRGCNDGGNEFMATAYLVRRGGPVAEATDPFNPFAPCRCTIYTSRKHVQRVVFIPDRTGKLDNIRIKQAIMQYGAVSTSMFMDETRYYNPSTSAYYYFGAEDSNHCVALAGWNDNYSRYNFKTPAPGNGAYLVKNSWGTDWGKRGYFYVSYYDALIGSGNALYNGNLPVTYYRRVYQYDPLGWTTSVGYSSDTAYFANIFTAPTASAVRAVGFYNSAVNSSYAAFLYVNCEAGNPRTGTLVRTKTGTISNPGFFTILFNSPKLIGAGHRFSVVVKLLTPGGNYPVPVEMPIPGYSSKATASAGQSFVSQNGWDWQDITSIFPNTNVCLKAYA